MLNIPNAFTQGASKVLVQAQISAAAMGFERIGTGHLLIGLCKCGDDLSRLMLGDVTTKEVEDEVFGIYGRGQAGFSRVTSMTPHAHRVLLRALTYANPEKKTLAGTVHLWLELLYEEGCNAHKALLELGVTLDRMKTTLLNTAGEIVRSEKAKAIPSSDDPLVVAFVQGKPEARAEKQDAPNALETFAYSLTQAAREQRLEPLIGREAEINAMIRVLGKKTKNNPMLLGEPGVGKSAIVEGLAQRVASGQVPAMLQNANIYALDLAQMVAGSKYRGEFEDRLKRVLDAAKKQENVILFIDEMHTMIGAGGSEGSLDAANILKPALARGQIRVIGATTHKEYRKHVEKDQALARRFQRIDVQEPDKAQTLEILEGLRARYEAFHHVEITAEAMSAAVELSSRYVTDRFMPDKAIDLIDEAASMAKLSESIPFSAEADNELSAQRDVEDIRAFETQEDNPGEPPSQVIIGYQDIARIVSEWTGVPYEHVCAAPQSSTVNLEKQLGKRVIAQEEAIAQLSKAIRRAQAGLNDPSRPLGVFMLLGPSGVGKTELCKALAETLFGREDALIRIDMSEFSEEASASRLIGSPPGYVGHGEGGQLTDAVLKHPYSVVLFDEIEKAHPKIFNLLLQLLDDGRLTDSVGRCVNFKNAIIMMTSNAGVSFDMDKQVGFSQSPSTGDTDKRSKAILAKARQVFRPEFIGRIDEMIVMRSLDQQAGSQIAALMLDQLNDRLSMRGVHIAYTPEVAPWLAERGVDTMSGARRLRRVIQEHVENPLSDLILSGCYTSEILIHVRDSHVVLHNTAALIEQT